MMVTLKKNLLGRKKDMVINTSIWTTGDPRFKTLDCCSLPMQSLANLAMIDPKDYRSAWKSAVKSSGFGRSEVQNSILRTSAPNPVCGNSMALSNEVHCPFLLPPDKQGNACPWLAGSGMEWDQPSALLLSPGCWRCLNFLWHFSSEPSPEVGNIRISFQLRLLFHALTWWNLPPLSCLWILCSISPCFSMLLSNSMWDYSAKFSIFKVHKVWGTSVRWDCMKAWVWTTFGNAVQTSA